MFDLKNELKFIDGVAFLNIHLIPNSSINKIVEISQTYIKIKLQAPAIDGKANKKLIELLSKSLKIPKSSILIVKGEKSKNKIIKLLLPDKF